MTNEQSFEGNEGLSRWQSWKYFQEEEAAKKAEELRKLGTFETEVDHSAWRVRYHMGEGRNEAGERVLHAARKN